MLQYSKIFPSLNRCHLIRLVDSAFERINIKGKNTSIRRRYRLRLQIDFHSSIGTFFCSFINISTCSSGKIIGNIPFLKQLLKKISAKEVDTTTLIPKSDKAQGACSREDPQPKLSPQLRCWLLYADLLSTKSPTSEPSEL